MSEQIAEGVPVRHDELGDGEVRAVVDESVIVRFGNDVEEVSPESLDIRMSLDWALESGVWSSPLETAVKSAAKAIRSTHQRWSVFSRSRIKLLPHQLWVAYKVLQDWPTRWMVADDVGLGKTIEAGLILDPLISSGRVERLLILAPASLTEQWQERLRNLFDLRVDHYHSDVDNEGAGYWEGSRRTVASLHTMRLDDGNRWERFLDADPWDMVMVDEAHHLGAHEDKADTLGYKLVEKMVERELVKSMVFFTGTPHRGKNYAFQSLLRLLKPKPFEPGAPMDEQLGELSEVMIRNNKSEVTDMEGEELFTGLSTESVTYEYTEKERAFYDELSDFILQGRAFAGDLQSQEQKAAHLVLTSMQKLASSSIGAVKSALKKRRDRLYEMEDVGEEAREARTDLDELRREIESVGEGNDPALQERRNELIEEIADASGDAGVRLSDDETQALDTLVERAEEVGAESRIQRVLDVVKERFADKPVLLFTEYKKTQALVYGALADEFGEGDVVFINGDGELKGVPDEDGESRDVSLTRDVAARRFNEGDARFLVSTQAAAEGVDLHHECSSLVHVDIPWNPMRLHQRVGRLHRYGQDEDVDVVIVHNPDTVDHKIWDKLENKLEEVTQAHAAAMDSPEDVKKLVLGSMSQGFFDELHKEGLRHRDEGEEEFDEWFDEQTATFGGEDAYEAVQDIVGHAAKFDFETERMELPKVDIPDLQPFFNCMLHLRGRQGIGSDSEEFSFRTPQSWSDEDHRIKDRYNEMSFQRPEGPEDDLEDVLGASHILFQIALDDAESLNSRVSVVPGLERPYLLVNIRGKYTDGDATVDRVVAAVTREEGEWRVLRDWELVQAVNEVLEHPVNLGDADGEPEEADGGATEEVNAFVDEAQKWFEEEGVEEIDTSFFRELRVSPELVLWPGEGVVE